MKKEEDIFVTKPEMPDFNEFTDSLKTIWESKILTNNGPFHQAFEQELKTHLNLDHISVYSNGTIALLAALKVLNLTGEIITTPYSFVATSHAIFWNNLTPVFADVCPKTGNLDPKSVEALINERTSAIMPVHVYGNPCDMDAFDILAEKYKLKLVYDAAHCFDVKQGDESILERGDLSILSFHATKVFNSIEGGAIVSKYPTLIEKLNKLKNFGFKNELQIEGYGINGKMNELQAAFGLLQLKSVATSINNRKLIVDTYHELLTNKNGISILPFDEKFEQNYSYMPIIIEESYSIDRDELYEKLKENGIYSRRYFYPLISNLENYKQFASANKLALKNANHLADKVLCLPLYAELSQENVKRICQLI
ncbi:MAG: DegT/DnrJ/EryC1/StrS family aminotransferase [Crocinitomicaceae bacterium]